MKKAFREVNGASVLCDLLAAECNWDESEDRKGIDVWHKDWAGVFSFRFDKKYVAHNLKEFKHLLSRHYRDTKPVISMDLLRDTFSNRFEGDGDEETYAADIRALEIKDGATDLIPEAKFINCTPHRINVLTKDGIVTHFMPSDIIPRLSEVEKTSDLDIGIEVVNKEYGEIEGLPKEEDGTYLIVSTMVLEANKKIKTPREDLLAPNTGKTAIRNEAGHIDYVVSLVK